MTTGETRRFLSKMQLPLHRAGVASDTGHVEALAFIDLIFLGLFAWACRALAGERPVTRN